MPYTGTCSRAAFKDRSSADLRSVPDSEEEAGSRTKLADHEAIRGTKQTSQIDLDYDEESNEENTYTLHRRHFLAGPVHKDECINRDS